MSSKKKSTKQRLKALEKSLKEGQAILNHNVDVSEADWDGLETYLNEFRDAVERNFELLATGQGTGITIGGDPEVTLAQYLERLYNRVEETWRELEHRSHAALDHHDEVSLRTYHLEQARKGQAEGLKALRNRVKALEAWQQRIEPKRVTEVDGTPILEFIRELAQRVDAIESPLTEEEVERVRSMVANQVQRDTQPDFPRSDGLSRVLGPQIIATFHEPGEKGSIINWRGANYVPQPEPKPVTIDEAQGVFDTNPVRVVETDETPIKHVCGVCKSLQSRTPGELRSEDDYNSRLCEHGYMDRSICPDCP